jgi:hypothetical protein
VDFAEFACDFPVADRIEEVAENGVRARVHVGTFAAPLQRLEFLDRVLPNHGLFDLRSGSFRHDVHPFSAPSIFEAA